ncbi:MAG: DUF5652 family protein [Patescibacteria group bacterium]
MYNPFWINVFINILVLILLLWTISWKIYAVWTAAQNNQKRWFIALLVLNTVGILEIFYIFKIAQKSWAEVKKDFSIKLSEIK